MHLHDRDKIPVSIPQGFRILVQNGLDRSHQICRHRRSEEFDEYFLGLREYGEPYRAKGLVVP